MSLDSRLTVPGEPPAHLWDNKRSGRLVSAASMEVSEPPPRYMDVIECSLRGCVAAQSLPTEYRNIGPQELGDFYSNERKNMSFTIG